MKITIEIPDWAKDRHIYILAGIESLAFKSAFENEVWVKETTCNFCGACCQNLPHSKSAQPLDENGNCTNLVKYGDRYECSLGMHRPFGCSIFDPVVYRWPNGEQVCSIRYKKIKVD